MNTHPLDKLAFGDFQTISGKIEAMAYQEFNRDDIKPRSNIAARRMASTRMAVKCTSIT